MQLSHEMSKATASMKAAQQQQQRKAFSALLSASK
jgi:hypothetical protein